MKATTDGARRTRTCEYSTSVSGDASVLGVGESGSEESEWELEGVCALLMSSSLSFGVNPA